MKRREIDRARYATGEHPIFLLEYHRYGTEAARLFTWSGPFRDQAEVQVAVDDKFDRLFACGFRYDEDDKAAVIPRLGPGAREGERFAIQFRTETYEPGDCP